MTTTTTTPNVCDCEAVDLPPGKTVAPGPGVVHTAFGCGKTPYVPDRLTYATPNDVFAGLRGGGTISVEEWPNGGLEEVAGRLDGKGGVVVIEVGQDGSEWPGAAVAEGLRPSDTVSVHPDESDKLALFDRAIEALENARAALLATGYVDSAHEARS